MEFKTFQECRQLEGWQPIRVASRSEPSKPHTVLVNPWREVDEYVCDCPAYQYRGKCRHQGEADSHVCKWSEWDNRYSQTDEQKDRMICPSCGGPTKWSFQVIE